MAITCFAQRILSGNSSQACAIIKTMLPLHFLYINACLDT